MKKRIHYHSDCAFFAGCENMLVNFWSAPALRREFEVSFSYRDSTRYTSELNRRISADFPLYPMRFPDISDPATLPGAWPLLLKRIVLLGGRLLLTMPLLSYEVLALWHVFMRVKPDIVHINCGGYPPALSARTAVIAAKLAGTTAIVMVVNNLAVDYARPSRWLGYPLDRLIARCVSRFVTGSAAAGAQLKKVLQLSEVKCRALHNGIALRGRTETPGQTRARLGLENFDGVILGVVAILRPNKGHQVLLDAMVRLLGQANNDVPKVKVLIEGDGPLAAQLKEFVSEKQLTDHCIFIGDEKNVMDFMAFIDVLVLPSVGEEDFPNVILEAMGLGKPVIASRLAGTPEQVVQDETGILVEPGNPEQLSEAITRLGSDEPLRARMGQAGLRRFQQRFTADTAIENYLSLYQSLVET